MLDLLLIRPNDAKAVYGAVSENAACEPPFWAGVIASYCRERGINVEILDAEAENLSPAEAAGKVQSLQPKLIGLIITGTNLSASTWKMNGAGLCAKEIKKQCETPIFMWGLHPSALPERTLAEESVDFVIKGEGLESVYHLTKTQLEKDHYDSIAGLYYRDTDGRIKGNFRLNLTDAKDFPEPAWDLIPMEKYTAHNWQRFGEQEEENAGYAVLATSLGCPFQCSFCAVSTLFGEKKVRFLEPEKVVEMIDHLVKDYHVKYIKILDELFVMNKQHVEKICDLLIERGYDLNIWAYARVDTVDERLLKKMRMAGIKWLAFGIESASELSLGDVSKGQYGLEDIKKSVQMTKEADIHVLANFMFGLPEDTRESMELTLQAARELCPEFINFYCTMAYPGSKLYEECLSNGIELPDTWLGYSQYSYECLPLPTKTLSAKEILHFRDEAFHRFFENNEAYFRMVEQRFGVETVADIKNILKNKLNRKILENTCRK